YIRSAHDRSPCFYWQAREAGPTSMQFDVQSTFRVSALRSERESPVHESSNAFGINVVTINARRKVDCSANTHSAGRPASAAGIVDGRRGVGSDRDDNSPIRAEYANLASWRKDDSQAYPLDVTLEQDQQTTKV